MTEQRRDARRIAGAKSRARILFVAKRLIAERGRDAVSLRDITTAANVNVASVSYHFGSKDELFQAAVDDALRTIATSYERELVALPSRTNVSTIAATLVKTLVRWLRTENRQDRILAMLSARALLSPQEQGHYDSVTAGLFNALQARLSETLTKLSEDELRFRARTGMMLLRGLGAGVSGYPLDALSAQELTALFIPVVAGTFAGCSAHAKGD